MSIHFYGKKKNYVKSSRNNIFLEFEEKNSPMKAWYHFATKISLLRFHSRTNLKWQVEDTQEKVEK